MKERLVFVDGLRGLAVLMVVLFHTWLFGGLYRFGPGTPPPSYWLATFSLGVNLFMVISGFCLTLPLVGPNGWRKMNVADFFRRRIVRILPPYYVAIALLALLGWLVPLLYNGHATAFTKPQLLGIGGHLLFSYNILAGFDADAPSLNGSFWSIELEAYFYLLLPLLVLAARHWGLLRVTVAVVLLSLAFRAFVWYTIDDFAAAQLYVFLARSAPARLSEFVFGIAAAVIYVRYHQRINASLMLGAAIVLLWLGVGYFFLQLGHFAPPTDIVVGAGFACLLLAGSVAGPLQRLLTWRPLADLGLISYSVYLIHEPVVKELFIWQPGRQGSDAFLTYSVGSTLIAIAFGYLFYRLVEQPALHWGKRIVRSHPTPAAPTEEMGITAAPATTTNRSG